MVSMQAPGLKQDTTTTICVAIQKRELQRDSFSLAQLHCGSLPQANRYNESEKKETFWNRQLGRLALQATVQCLKLIIRCYDEQNTGALNTASNNRINNRLLNVT